MPSSKTQIVHYLIERGLLPQSSVVDGEVLVAEASSRNRNFAVVRESGGGFFVKEAQLSQPMAAQTLMREAACYSLVQHDAALEPLRALMPKFYSYDPQRHILVIDLVPNGESLAAWFWTHREFPPSLACKLGVALGTYHAHVSKQLKSDSYQSVFPRQLPWALTMPRLQASSVMNLSAANAQMFSIVQRYPQFHPRLEQLAAGWRVDSLIHGDMKFENCVLSPAEDAAGEPELRVVDWEIADIGDSRWDAGSVLQAFVNLWVFSIPAVPGRDLEHSAIQSQFPIEKMQPAIRAFWSAYRERIGVAGSAGADILRTCVSYGAARLVQTVYESMYSMPQLTPQAVLLLQVSLNILQDPDAAISDLLGLKGVA